MHDLTADPALMPPEPLLAVRGLRRHFGSMPAVDGVDLNVYSGEIYGFLGINGAGKTTTIRTLMGIIAAEAGTITLMGETTHRATVKQKRKIGYVSQEQTFYPWMSCRALGRFVRSFYPTWDQREFDRLLAVFSIPEERRVSHLSGGMRAKLALALALAPKPDLLILDEPTAGLDPVARREFMDIIVEEAREHQRTTFFSSHLIDEVERCADRIGILHAGRMRFEGRLEELRGQVRRLILPKTNEPQELPLGFQIWQERSNEAALERVVQAPQEAWSSLSLPEGAEVKYLGLEEIFIACVSTRRSLA
jgi:ABC-2 type transport system ATP-binding protein